MGYTTEKLSLSKFQVLIPIYTSGFSCNVIAESRANPAFSHVSRGSFKQDAPFQLFIFCVTFQ